MADTVICVDVDDVGPALGQLRKLRGMTQQEVARRSGLSMWTISNLEHGTSSPTLGTVRRVATVLGCTVEVSLCREKQEEEK